MNDWQETMIKILKSNNKATWLSALAAIVSVPLAIIAVILALISLLN